MLRRSGSAGYDIEPPIGAVPNLSGGGSPANPISGAASDAVEGVRQPAAPAPRPANQADPAPSVDIGIDSDDGPLVKAGMGGGKPMAIAGFVLTIIASAIAALTAHHGTSLPEAVSTFYQTLLHAASGTAALTIAAALLDRKIGRIELGAARMFLAVAVFQTLIAVDLKLPFRFAEPVVAVAGYFLTVWILFRTRPNTVVLIGAIHSMIVLAILLGAKLTSWADASLPAGAAAGTGS